MLVYVYFNYDNVSTIYVFIDLLTLLYYCVIMILFNLIIYVVVLTFLCFFCNTVHLLSCSVDPNTPVHERLNQEAELKRQEKERFEQLRLENALKNHTFTPQINETSKSLVTQRSFIGSPEGGGIGGGSVSGDDIFSRLNAQSTIAKSPRPLNNSVVVSSPSPTRTRSMVISEEERDKLYERLSAAPKTLPPPGTPGAGGEDDRSSVNNRKTAAQIDDVVSRLHATHTKAMKAPVFEDPVPLQSMLRTRSMSNVSTPVRVQTSLSLGATPSPRWTYLVLLAV